MANSSIDIRDITESPQVILMLLIETRHKSISGVAGESRTAVPDEFQFACKAQQRITHSKRLKEFRDEVKAFLNLTKVLK